MANMFASLAKKETTLSRILENREKLTTEEMVKKFPNGCTLIDFDMITLDEESFPVFAIREDDKICFFGGLVLTKIVGSWIEYYGGDYEKAAIELRTSGGVKIKFEPTKTKAGKSLTAIKIIE